MWHYFGKNKKSKYQARQSRLGGTARQWLLYPTLVLWSPYTKQNIQKIEMVQRRAARWVSNSYSYYDSVSAMLSSLDWRSLEYRRYDSRLAMFYKIQYGLFAVSMPSYFERSTRINRHMHSFSFRQILPGLICGTCFC